jgi:hypothetical protein
MTDTEVSAAATLVAAFGGVVLGTVLAWLGERGRRRFEARTRLAEERDAAGTRLAETATEAYMAIEHMVRQYQLARSGTVRASRSSGSQSRVRATSRRRRSARSHR